MKPKEIIKKFEIQGGWDKSLQDEFLACLTSEFLVFIEYYRAENNIKGFNNAIDIVRMKWDAISNKIRYGLPEELWSYFYATTINSIKAEVCPIEVARLKRIKEERLEQQRQEDEQQKIWAKEQEERRKEWEQSYNKYQQDAYERISLMYLMLLAIPTDSFNFMSLPTCANELEIKRKYKEMALKMHPYRGGSQENFTKLIDAKNRCLKWCSIKK